MGDVCKRLVGPKQLANSATTEYTAPGGTTTTVRLIHFSNPGSTDRTVTVSIGADAAGTRIFDAFNIPAGTVFGYPCHITLAAAEILQMSANAATAVVVCIDGVESS